ncbi:MAG TPA: hypothetical protein VKK81_21980 [Candidatus Binatia bacterium]|nr:hypothetical protein [Candidatus Binatia bacterium]
MGVQKGLRFFVPFISLLLVISKSANAEENRHEEIAMTELMSSPHMHAGMEAHMKWTTPRPRTPADQQRAEEIVKTLRVALDKYRDYRVAEKDGFKPFLPQFPQPMYHFTNYWQGFKAAFTFDPARPTSLLYRKTADGYELIGAMYTAPKRMTEEKLNERVPLSVTRWHAHINICLPPRGQTQQADWAKFGFRGSIATAEECARTGGRFWPQIFGWMVHVYPFEEASEKIWSQ